MPDQTSHVQAAGRSPDCLLTAALVPSVAQQDDTDIPDRCPPNVRNLSATAPDAQIPRAPGIRPTADGPSAEWDHVPVGPEDRSGRTPAAVWREFPAVASRIQDRRQAWTEMLRMIANRLDLDVCSLYLMDSGSGELVLSATMGLTQNCVGTIRLRPTQGLVGLVAQKMHPVYIPDVSRHSRFRKSPEAGDEPFSSFFGVPLVFQELLIGVLAVYAMEPRDFRPDWAALAAAAWRLTPHVRGA